jgi:hypothetical protein
VIGLGNSPLPVAVAGDFDGSNTEDVGLNLVHLPPNFPTSLTPVTGSVFGTGVGITSLPDFEGSSSDNVTSSAIAQAESLVESLFETNSSGGDNGVDANGGSAFGFLGIVPRDATFDEQYSSALNGHTVYDDSPKTMDASDSDMRVAIPRVPPEEAQLGKQLSRELFYAPALDADGKPIINPSTGQPKLVDRTNDIRETFSEAYREYRTLYPTRETSFVDFLKESSKEQKALKYAELVKSLNDLIGRLGLSSHEEASARRKLFVAVTPPDVSMDEFLKAF